MRHKIKEEVENINDEYDLDTSIQVKEDCILVDDVTFNKSEANPSLIGVFNDEVLPFVKGIRKEKSQPFEPEKFRVSI